MKTNGVKENGVHLGRIYYIIDFLFKIGYLAAFLSEDAFLATSWSSFQVEQYPYLGQLALLSTCQRCLHH